MSFRFPIFIPALHDVMTPTCSTPFRWNSLLIGIGCDDMELTSCYLAMGMPMSRLFTQPGALLQSLI
jgi:hypothetical protein